MATFDVAYSETPPPPGLAPWVECSWELKVAPAASAHPHRVLPDGCIDLVWTLEDGLRIAGPNTTAFVSALAPGTRTVGVRLRPGGAPRLFGVPAVALLDTMPRPEQLWGSAGERLAADVEAAATGPERLAAMLGWLAGRAARADAPDPLVGAVVAILRVRGLNIRAVANEIGYSERHLQRRIVEHVGYGPKHLARVLRLQRALGSARTRPREKASLTEIACEAGYADHAHFTHEARLLAGVTPTDLLAKV